MTSNIKQMHCTRESCSNVAISRLIVEATNCTLQVEYCFKLIATIDEVEEAITASLIWLFAIDNVSTTFVKNCFAFSKFIFTNTIRGIQDKCTISLYVTSYNSYNYYWYKTIPCCLTAISVKFGSYHIR